MKMYYIANARIPTEKAHGLTIVKSCESFARAGADVTLIVPRRKTQFQKDIYETYGVGRNFAVRYVPVFDVLRYSSSRFAFWLSYASFYLNVFFILLAAPKKNAVLYTRDAPFLAFSVLGVPAFLESHHLFGNARRYLRLARFAKGIIPISHALKDRFVAAGYKKENIIVAPSGVELRTFLIDTAQADARKDLTLPIDKKIITYTGNFTTMGQDKGISDILHALTHLPGVLFVAAGGSEKDIERYMSEAQGLGVSAQARFVGFAPQTTLALYQRAADILLMPFPDTPHYRNNMSPVKMFEYMASGRPIVATDLPTIREVLNDTNAAIVPPGDTVALAQAIRGLLENKEKAQQLAQQAKKDVLAYSWDERAKNILSFIKNRNK